MIINKKIPFGSLQVQNSKYEHELIEACTRVVRSGRYVLGSEKESFELDFAEYLGVDHCCGVGNGFDAIKIILHAWILMGRLKEGDGVLVPANSFVASAYAVNAVGLVPIFCDVDTDTFNMTPQTVLSSLNNNVRVIMAVHLFGRMAPLKDICRIAKSKGILVLEDCAQAHGAILDGVSAGVIGDAGAFSFYPGKNLGALGDAGAVVTNCTDLINTVNKISNYGSSKKYCHEFIGVNSRLDEMQAALLGVKLKYLDEEIIQRRNIANRYTLEISNPLIKVPSLIEDNLNVWHQYVIKTNYRAQLLEFLSDKVETLIHYPIPIHKQKPYEHLLNTPLNNVEELSQQIVSLPIAPYLTHEEQSYIIDSLNNFNL